MRTEREYGLEALAMNLCKRWYDGSHPQRPAGSFFAFSKIGYTATGHPALGGLASVFASTKSQLSNVNLVVSGCLETTEMTRHV